MGHVRVGCLPKKWGWEQVISALSTGSASGSEGESDLISQAAQAANRTLSDAKYQGSVALAYWTFVDLAAASRTGDLLTHLGEQGVQIPERPTGLTLLKLISTTLEKTVRARGASSALDEIALQTFDAVVLSTARSGSETLFGCSVESVQTAFRELSTKAGVADIGRRFFSEYTFRALRLALEKELARSLGKGGRFNTSNELSRFEERLKTYCWDVSKIVEDYSGGWYSKALWEQRLTLAEARNFTSYAIQKLLSELSREPTRL
jgi:hypothetical protein